MHGPVPYNMSLCICAHRYIIGSLCVHTDTILVLFVCVHTDTLLVPFVCVYIDTLLVLFLWRTSDLVMLDTPCSYPPTLPITESSQCLCNHIPSLPYWALCSGYQHQAFLFIGVPSAPGRGHTVSRAESYGKTDRHTEQRGCRGGGRPNRGVKAGEWPGEFCSFGSRREEQGREGTQWWVGQEQLHLDVKQPGPCPEGRRTTEWFWPHSRLTWAKMFHSGFRFCNQILPSFGFSYHREIEEQYILTVAVRTPQGLLGTVWEVACWEFGGCHGWGLNMPVGISQTSPLAPRQLCVLLLWRWQSSECAKEMPRTLEFRSLPRVPESWFGNIEMCKWCLRRFLEDLTGMQEEGLGKKQGLTSPKYRQIASFSIVS